MSTNFYGLGSSTLRNALALRLLLHQGAELIVIDLPVLVLVSRFDDLAGFLVADVLVAENVQNVLELAAGNVSIAIHIERLYKKRKPQHICKRDVTVRGVAKLTLKAALRSPVVRSPLQFQKALVSFTERDE